MIESGTMKILKIENGCGLYLTTDKEWEPIDKIDKEGLLNLLNLFLDNDAEMDEVEDDNISNQAHQIIYGNIFEKFSTLSDNKKKFNDESDRLYLEEIQKYSN